MTRRPAGGEDGGERGFTLIEALVALAIGGFVIATLATITGQWMRNWRHGYPVLERSEMLVTSLDRIVADLSAIRILPASSTGPGIIFTGTDSGVTLVRRALPVEASTGLELVRLAPLAGDSDVTLARSRSTLRFRSFAKVPTDGAPVVLLRPPYAIRFAYAETDGTWQTTWTAIDHLPLRIRVAVVDRQTGRAVMAPVVVALHVDAPVQCFTALAVQACNSAVTGSPGSPAVPAQPGATAAARADGAL